MPRRKSTNVSTLNTPVYAPQSVGTTPDFQPLEPPKIAVENLDAAPLTLSRPLPPAPVSVQKLRCENYGCEKFNDGQWCCELDKLKHDYRKKIGELLGSTYNNTHITNGCVCIDNEKWEKELYECTLPIIQMIQKLEDKEVWESKLKDYGLRDYPWEVKMLREIQEA